MAMVTSTVMIQIVHHLPVARESQLTSLNVTVPTDLTTMVMEQPTVQIPPA